MLLFVEVAPSRAAARGASSSGLNAGTEGAWWCWRRLTDFEKAAAAGYGNMRTRQSSPSRSTARSRTGFRRSTPSPKKLKPTDAISSEAPRCGSSSPSLEPVFLRFFRCFLSSLPSPPSADPFPSAAGFLPPPWTPALLRMRIASTASPTHCRKRSLLT